MQYESERIEYKSQLTDEIYKEVIAFANTDGGIIYIGVDDQGNATGIDDVDGTYTRLTNGVRDAIRPDVTMLFAMCCRITRSFVLKSVRAVTSRII